MDIANIAGIVRLHGQERPDQVAIVYGDREVTWRELDETSNQLANALVAAGVQANDRIARIEKNAPDYFELAFAASKINAVLVDVNWRLAAGRDAPDRRRRRRQGAVRRRGVRAAPRQDRVRAGHRRAHGPARRRPTPPTSRSTRSRRRSRPPTRASRARSQDVCLQLYTSGTTGLPKGVMLSNENLFSFIDEVPKNWDFTPESVSHVVMPTFHIAGSGLGAREPGDGLADDPRPRGRTRSQILQEVEAHGITHAIYVPAVLQFLQIVPNAHDHDLSSMQLVAYGASPITEQVLRDAMAQFATAKFVQVYGLTETTGAVVQLDAADHDPENRPELLRSAGKPYPWIELRVVGADGEDVAPGRDRRDLDQGRPGDGRLLEQPRRRPRRPSPTDGWFRSGDAGYLDEDGYLFLHDRVKDMIVSGGENVYPAEVENAVMGCPGVADVAVIGVPDEKWGEAVKAIVVKQADADVTADQVIAWARERIAGFKVPKSVDFVDELPRNPSGKILKKDLRAPYWEGRERQIN